MTINLTADQFTLVGGAYYSPNFKQDEKDALFTIGITLGVNGECSLQNTIDEINWDDITDSVFTCDPFGLQSYIDGHYLTVYRIKATQAPISAKILI